MSLTEEHLSKEQAESFLTSLLNRTLRVTTTDTRMFLGEFKCTDPDRNIILQSTFEYRLPSPPSLIPGATKDDKVLLDMTSRYLGLVVVPGEHITKIEVEEFVSQMKGHAKDDKVAENTEAEGEAIV